MCTFYNLDIGQLELNLGVLAPGSAHSWPFEHQQKQSYQSPTSALIKIKLWNYEAGEDDRDVYNEVEESQETLDQS